MTDRLARFCGVSLTALSLALSTSGCGQQSPSVDSPVAANSAPAEAPRLLEELGADQGIESPLLLGAPTESPMADAPMALERGLSLGVPPADRGAYGEEITAEPAPTIEVTENTSKNLLQPPVDRGASQPSDEEAPLPELVNFDSPEGLAAQAASINRDSIQGTPESEAADAASATHPSDVEVAATVTPAVPNPSPADGQPPPAPVVDTPPEVVAVEPRQPVESGPLPSTGALAINRVETVGPTDRQITRIEIPGGQKRETTAVGDVAAVPAPRKAPATSDAVQPAEAEVADLEQESLAASPPPAKKEVAAIVPAVDPLQARRAEGDVAATATTPANPGMAMSSVRPTAPLATAAAPTTTVPPASVDSGRSTAVAMRVPLPATELPPQAPVVDNSRPAEPTAAAGLAKRGSPLKPVVTLPAVKRLASDTAPTAPPANLSAPTRLPAGEKSPAVANRPSRDQRLPTADVTPSPLPVAPPTSEIAGKSRPGDSMVPRKPNAPAAPNLAAAPPTNPPLKPRPVSQPTSIAGQQPAMRPMSNGDRVLAAAGPVAPTRSSELIAISQMADEHSRQAFNLANRGALYSARDEFIAALQMVAHAIDADQRTYEHSQALADGLTAIRESDDFSSRGGRSQDNVDVVSIAKTHSTPVLKGHEPKSVSRMAAMQQYYTYAQRRLAFAVSAEPSGSVALYGLGKLYTVLAQLPPQGIVAPEPKAIVFHQAALLVDGRNYMAANDLGVLLARYGKYQQAKSALLHSLSIQPQPAAWHNLTVVHQHLGEAKLAQLAYAESQASKARAKQVARSTGQSMTDTTTVVWLDPVTFSKSSEMWSDPAKPQTSDNATQTTARKPPAPQPEASPKKGWFRK